MELAELPTNEDWNSWGYVLHEPVSDACNYSEYGGIYSVYDHERVEDITAGDIARVDAWDAHSPEGYASTDVVALVELADGTWAALTAWCDTTGWDCQSDVTWRWARTREDAIRFGLDRAGRERLGLDPVTP